MDWAEKYRPQRLDEVVGNSPALRRMYEWGISWTRKSPPLILYGKPGTGKTSSAHALAADMGWEVIELNASDQRTKAVIERIAGISSMTGSLMGASRKLIILDEADNLQGTADRGGARAIIDVIRKAQQPIILIANDLHGLAAELRSQCEPVQFRALQARSIAPRLRFICASEGIQCADTALRELSEVARGDMRQAINTLYASAIGRTKLDESQIRVSRKDERSTIFDLVAAVFGAKPGDELLQISYEVDETPDTIEQWIEANVHHIHDHGSITQAYECLSRADEYIGYTYRQQHYTLWRYATTLMLLGVSRASGACGIHARITIPARWKRMAGYRKQKSVRSALTTRLAEILHMAQHTLREGYTDMISSLIDRDPFSYVEEFEMDAEELTLFIHDKSRASEIMKQLAFREEQREKQKKEQEKARQKEEKRREKERTSVSPPASDKKRYERRQATLDGF
jgi:replication factor C large subunit